MSQITFTKIVKLSHVLGSLSVQLKMPEILIRTSNKQENPWKILREFPFYLTILIIFIPLKIPENYVPFSSGNLKLEIFR